MEIELITQNPELKILNSRNLQHLVGLDAEAPRRVVKAVAHGVLRILLDVRPVHGLKEEMIEVEVGEPLWPRTVLSSSG